MSDHEHPETSTAVDQWESVEVIERPAWPKVIGIISIVWGGLGLCYRGLVTGYMAVAPSLIESQLNGDPVPDAMRMGIADWLIALVSLGLALLLIFGGITAVSYRPLTRVLHLLYGALSIPLAAVRYINNSAKQDKMMEWAEQYPNNPISQSMQSMDPNSLTAAISEVVSLAFLIVLGFGVPVFYLIWFGLIKTKPEQITGGDEGVY